MERAGFRLKIFQADFKQGDCRNDVYSFIPEVPHPGVIPEVPNPGSRRGGKFHTSA